MSEQIKNILDKNAKSATIFVSSDDAIVSPKSIKFKPDKSSSL